MRLRETVGTWKVQKERLKRKDDRKIVRNSKRVIIIIVIFCGEGLGQGRSRTSEKRERSLAEFE